jgi:hypothetical protein
MTRRTTSRAPGMFPGRQPSSHPNPCLGRVCSRYAGSERTPRRSRKVQNDGCQAGSRDGFEPQGGALAPNTHDGLETRQSEARRRRGGSGPQTRRRRGFHNAPQIRHIRREPQVVPETWPGAGLTACRWRVPTYSASRGRQDTPSGRYHSGPWARDPATPRAAVLTQRDAGPVTPRRGPPQRAAGRVPNTSERGLRGFRARRSSYGAARSFSARTHTPR